MSAAKAAADHMRDWWVGTKPGEWVSMGIVSDGSYGIAKNLVFSFPVTIKDKQYKIVQVRITYIILQSLLLQYFIILSTFYIILLFTNRLYLLIEIKIVYYFIGTSNE